jgi:hypothetical protein
VKTSYHWLCLVLGLILMTAVAYPLQERALAGKNDFLQLWAGIKLVGTPDLYEPDASKREHVSAVGTAYQSVYFTRLPFYPFLLQPLGRLPYQFAYITFQCLSMFAFGAFLWLFRRDYPDLILLAGLSIPLLATLMNGQDLGIVLLLAGSSVLLLRRERDFAAGFVLAFCSIKFHLFLPIGLAVIVQRKWRMLWGGVAGGALLIALSFIAAGTAWPSAYLRLLTNPELHPRPDFMPTLRNLAYSFAGSSVAFEIATAIAIIGLFLYIAIRETDFEYVFAIGIVSGLLIGWHAYSQDCVLLLLTAALLVPRAISKSLRGALFFVMLPPIYLLLLAGAPVSVAIPLSLVAVLLFAVRDQVADPAVRDQTNLIALVR